MANCQYKFVFLNCPWTGHGIHCCIYKSNANNPLISLNDCIKDLADLGIRCLQRMPRSARSFMQSFNEINGYCRIYRQIETVQMRRLIWAISFRKCMYNIT